MGLEMRGPFRAPDGPRHPPRHIFGFFFFVLFFFRLRYSSVCVCVFDGYTGREEPKI